MLNIHIIIIIIIIILVIENLSPRIVESRSPCLDLGNPLVNSLEVTVLGTAICQRVVAHHVPGDRMRIGANPGRRCHMYSYVTWERMGNM